MSAWDRPQPDPVPLRRRMWLVALVVVILAAGVLVVDLTRPPAAPPVPGAVEWNGPHPLR